jgi:hypothetical protein
MGGFSMLQGWWEKPWPQKIEYNEYFTFNLTDLIDILYNIIE